MKKFHLIIILLSLLTVNAYGQRAIKGFDSFWDYREIGELRFWTFIVSDSVVGTLLSTVKEEISIDGSEGYRIEEKLKLDYNKANIALKMDILNQHYVTSRGYHLGDKMVLNINDQSEKMEVFREGEKVEGFATRNGEKDDVSISFDHSTFFIENNYFDQLEIYLAAQDMTVGTVFQDSFYMPQSMTYNYILGESWLLNSQLYNQVFDSSFVIEFSKPFEQLIYFTPDKRLVKISIPSQNLKAYLDAVRNPQKALAELEKTALRKGKFVETSAKNHLGSYLGGFVAYLILGLVSILFFIKSGYKLKETYLAFLTGCLVYIILPFTQIPLQKYLESAVFLPNVTAGGSPFLGDYSGAPGRYHSGNAQDPYYHSFHSLCYCQKTTICNYWGRHRIWLWIFRSCLSRLEYTGTASFLA